jgi:carboxylesterase
MTAPQLAPQPLLPKPLQLKGGRHGVLLFHGLSSSPLELQFIARGIQRAGYTVHVPVIEGYTHGLTSSQPRHVGQWLASALKELDQLLAQCETVSVGGLCLGAVMALRVAALRSDRLAGVLALSTALHYDGWGNPWFTRLLPLARYTPFARRIKIKERAPFGLKDERMRAWVARQMKEAGNSDAGACALRVGDLLKARDLIALARGSLSDITAPVLLIHAKDDECATPRSAFEVASQVQASRIRCVLLHDCYHMISIDREKERVLSEMVQFLSHSERGAHAQSLPERATVRSLFDIRQG